MAILSALPRGSLADNLLVKGNYPYQHLDRDQAAEIKEMIR